MESNDEQTHTHNGYTNHQAKSDIFMRETIIIKMSKRNTTHK